MQSFSQLSEQFPDIIQFFNAWPYLTPIFVVAFSLWRRHVLKRFSVSGVNALVSVSAVSSYAFFTIFYFEIKNQFIDEKTWAYVAQLMQLAYLVFMVALLFVKNAKLNLVAHFFVGLLDAGLSVNIFVILQIATELPAYIPQALVYPAIIVSLYYFSQRKQREADKEPLIPLSMEYVIVDEKKTAQPL